MMRYALTLCVVTLLLVTPCPAQQQQVINIRPTDQATCTGTGLLWVATFATNYSASSTIPKSICVFSDYEVACPTIEGVVPCDTSVNTCKPWAGTNAWKAADTLSVWSSTAASPSVCLQHGTLKFNPDHAILVVVQPLVSSVVFLALAVAVFIIFRNKVHMGSIAIVIMMCIIGCIQTVSYYYLNAYIVIAAGLIALAAYAHKTPASVGFGMFILLGAFFWVTFSTGLGNIQHHTRWNAGTAMEDTYEIACNTYYAGFFTYPRALMSDSHNVQNQYRGYCNRSFLAAQLFLMIVQEYFLILLIAMGAYAITEPDTDRSLKTEMTESF